MKRTAFLAAGAVLALSGCGLLGGTGGSDAAQQSTSQGAAATTKQAVPGGTAAAAEAAMETAVHKHDGNVVGLRNIGGDQWQVTVYSGSRVREVTVTQDGTKVTKSEAPKAAKTADEDQWEGVKITLKQAVVNALHHQAGRVLSARISDSGGELHFEVRIIPPTNDSAVTVKLTSRSGDVIGS